MIVFVGGQIRRGMEMKPPVRAVPFGDPKQPGGTQSRVMRCLESRVCWGSMLFTRRHWVSIGAQVLLLVACTAKDPQTRPSADAPQPAPPGAVVIKPTGGLFEGQVVVELASTSATAEVHYTLDGSAPTLLSPVYSMPLTITESTRIRARAFEGESPLDAGVGAVFVARSFDVSSDLPLVVVDGYGGGKPNRKQGGDWVTQEAAVIAIESKNGVARLSDAASLATRAGYHVRGQSSASFEKAPYKVEFWDETNDDVDLPFVGLPAESDWALIGPYEDRSLIRHAFAFELGRQLGIVAPRYAFAEVYINQDGGPLGPDDYEGVYMITETIKNSKRRLDLKQLDENDTEPAKISGGYIFKFDWAAAQEPLITCSGDSAVQHGFGLCPTEGAGQFPAVDCGAGGFGGGGGGFGGGGGLGGGGSRGGTCWADLEVVDPDPLNAAQRAYLTDYITAFNDAIHQSPLGAYGEYIEVASFVDTLILNELVRNGDAYTRSVYFYKERNQKIVAGPLWDFNLTLASGGTTFCNNNPVGWAYEFRRGSNDWFQRLIGDPAFSDQVRSRWRALRSGVLSQTNLEALIAAITAPLTNAVVRDYARWPICDVANGIFTVPKGDTWEAQLQVMRDFLRARAEWIDTQW